MKHRICRMCGLRWNVSAIEPGGKVYICPKCEKNKRVLAEHYHVTIKTIYNWINQQKEKEESNHE